MSPRLSGRALQAFRHLSLCMFQHLRSIHILPPSVADIDGSDFFIAAINCTPSARLQSLLPTAGLRPLEIVEDLHGTNEQAGINRIVAAAGFSRYR